MTFKRNEHIFHVMFWDHLVKIYADYQRDFRLSSKIVMIVVFNSTKENVNI